jgi:cell division protein FtsI/penicillin-binding protein 2
VSTKRGAILTAAILAVVGVAAAVFWFGPFGDDDPAPRDGMDESDPAVAAAADFARNWSAGTLGKSTYPAGTVDVAAATGIITFGLAPAEPNPKVEVTRVDTSEGAGDRAVAQAKVTWTLGPDQTWSYPTSFPLARQGDDWLIGWTPAVVHPSLADGELLEATRTVGARGRILAADGSVLVGPSGQVVVGIRKSRATDLATTAREVASLTEVDLAELEAKLAAAGPDDFVEVTTLERADYDRIRDQIQPLPGTVFRVDEGERSVPSGFARGVLGSSGPATEEIAAESDGTIRVGDETGLSGLARTQNAVLGGTPGIAVVAGPPEGPKRTLKAFPGTDGSDVTVTLDAAIQSAADAAVAATGEPSALVAIRISTGDVVAVANGPAGSTGYNRAFIGRYAPGSVFKIASTWSLLDHGLTPDTVVDCPATLTVGKTFKNAGGFSLGSVPFRTDFARSCNTAFVSQASKITPQQLADAASALGYRSHDLGAPMFQSSVPVDGDATEHAAQMIGQGRVEGNVLSVALMSASIASGTSVQPRLIIDPDAPDPVMGEALPADRIAIMRDLMRAVVTEGTGEALASVPGDPVHAKTGTAEFGNESPPETHAWITGFQGDLAFAVVVEGGGGGGSVAGPIAADFLRRLAGP